jgi:hypothetical protein
MIIKIATCLLAVSLFTSCASTQTASTGAPRQTLEQRMLAQSSSVADTTASIDQPMPPGEGPEEVGEGPADPNRNPALLPTPLLRANAVGGL